MSNLYLIMAHRRVVDNDRVVCHAAFVMGICETAELAAGVIKELEKGPLAAQGFLFMMLLYPVCMVNRQLSDSFLAREMESMSACAPELMDRLWRENQAQ